MPRLSVHRLGRPRLAHLVTALFLVGLLAFGVGVGFARTLNGVQLDDGTCGPNLQLGSNKTASSSATPSFLLNADGNKATYQVFIDGTSIGNFTSDSIANVCIQDTRVL